MEIKYYIFAKKLLGLIVILKHKKLRLFPKYLLTKSLQFLGYILMILSYNFN